MTFFLKIYFDTLNFTFDLSGEKQNDLTQSLSAFSFEIKQNDLKVAMCVGRQGLTGLFCLNVNCIKWGRRLELN